MSDISDGTVRRPDHGRKPKKRVVLYGDLTGCFRCRWSTSFFAVHRCFANWFSVLVLVFNFPFQLAYRSTRKLSGQVVAVTCIFPCPHSLNLFLDFMAHAYVRFNIPIALRVSLDCSSSFFAAEETESRLFFPHRDF